ncbi:putative NBD/HSP70 family sugar kinase [Motilibacter peucedani]|uniref:Putative NBD/HSP70 family sugar kinase n=1 Tax=Motilibacter peucedani TaxID=598650 RepID=A0A420XMV4_9ACTN|nr:ROK family protein [Motilibacter peucedani]RKS72608.1 putative NBD/HSP70 family sugar kinase [Motilibacter peucedani]
MPRRLNTALVLNAVRLAAPAGQRIAELVAATGLARPTVALAVEDLVAEGLLVPSTPSQEGGLGRPAVRVQLAGSAAHVLGVDLGVHSVAVAVADLTGRWLALVREPVAADGSGPADDGTDAMLRALSTAVDGALSEAGLGVDAVAGLTVGTPGIVDAEGRISFAGARGQWSSMALLEQLEATFRAPLRLENNANLVASAVYASQVSPPHTLLAVQWGERLGAGIVIDGVVHRGATAAAGEIGYVSPRGAPVRIGMAEQGPLEARIGTAGIVARAAAAAADVPTSALHPLLSGTRGAADAALVFEAAAGGDETARSVVAEVAEVFAAAIAPVVLALNPDALVIGGGIARAGSLLTEAIQVRLDRLTLHSPRVELSTLAQDAVVTGAVQVAREDLWRRLLATDDERVDLLREPRVSLAR